MALGADRQAGISQKVRPLGTQRHVGANAPYDLCYFAIIHATVSSPHARQTIRAEYVEL